MTHKEMSEIFAVMLLAYPNAEVFKGGIAKLGPTINLWVTCLPEIDFWTGQQAVVKLVRECKFPPTIAEFKEKAEKVQAEVRARIDQAWNYLKLDMDFGKTPEEAVARLSEGTDIRRVIEAMGGPSRLIATGERTFGDGTVSGKMEISVSSNSVLTPMNIVSLSPYLSISSHILPKSLGSNVKVKSFFSIAIPFLPVAPIGQPVMQLQLGVVVFQCDLDDDFFAPHGNIGDFGFQHSRHRLRRDLV